MQVDRSIGEILPERLNRVGGQEALTTTMSIPDEIAWQTPSDVALDKGGPVDRPFHRLGPLFADVPAIEHLRTLNESCGQRVALSDATCDLTYSELIARALSLANRISSSVPEGHAVGSLLRSSIWSAVAMLACMSAGRPLVPLNPRDPIERLRTIAATSRVSLLLGQDTSGPIGWTDEEGLQWLDVERASEPLATIPSLAPVSVDEPAVVLYTSGSTGQPKGVVNSQRSLLQRVQQYVDACHINSSDVFMPLSGPTTIAGCREMLSALMTGARLHVVDVEALGLRGLLRQMRSQRVTITYIVPALLRAVVAANEAGDFDSLRIVRIGGEKVLWTDIALIRSVVKPHCFLQVSYSSTETTGTQWFLRTDLEDSHSLEDETSAPVGYLLPGIWFAVIDENGLPVRSGEVGELVIRSPYVLLGYWEHGRVFPMPADPENPRDRIFSTGDLVSVDDGGLMTVVGRKGRQLKINGRRVEPAELEAVVRRIPRVQDAVAIVTDANEIVVFACCAGKAEAEFTTDVRNVIRQKLPTALHPTRLHEIAEIPRLSGGKVDIAALKALDLHSRRGPTGRQQPDAAEAEEARSIVNAVWTSILNTTDAVGRWDEAGGDSLKLLRCVMDLEKVVGNELPMQAFTVDMTAADMAFVIANRGKRDEQRRSSAPLPHLVILPGSMGYGPSMAVFGAQLGATAQVVPIRYPDLTSTLAGRGTIDDMASHAVEQIVAAQPTGDIRLIGYSLGGGVAFEVADRLLAAGRRIKFLGILDTNIGPRTHQRRETMSRTMQRIRSHRMTLHRTLCRSVAKGVVHFGWETKFCRMIDATIWTRLASTRFMLRLEIEEVLRMQEFNRWRTKPKNRLPIAGTLFLCNRRGVSPDLGWNSLFTHLDVVPIAGGHLDLVIEPHLSLNRPVIERSIAAS